MTRVDSGGGSQQPPSLTAGRPATECLGPVQHHDQPLPSFLSSRSARANVDSAMRWVVLAVIICAALCTPARAKWQDKSEAKAASQALKEQLRELRKQVGRATLVPCTLYPCPTEPGAAPAALRSNLRPGFSAGPARSAVQTSRTKWRPRCADGAGGHSSACYNVHAATAG